LRRIKTTYKKKLRESPRLKENIEAGRSGILRDGWIQYMDILRSIVDDKLGGYGRQSIQQVRTGYDPH
jgi:hypothetical protein